ncbi:hypothetical membrane protein [Pelotomaculum thermopropionicum SI]|uniref:Hypothetical membrane protein n=1 Tax=Pelotomaculum thermopropionicum (strain DSM 13744 / JCM 10971 / SI) TaxID=370438 RepID=A5D4A2_PELTS|nr:hypothetical membrane protein [Pelotomaculum thermopropionicum SI]
MVVGFLNWLKILALITWGANSDRYLVLLVCHQLNQGVYDPVLAARINNPNDLTGAKVDLIHRIGSFTRSQLKDTDKGGLI